MKIPRQEYTAEFKELAVKVGITGLSPAAWQEPEVSYGYQVVEAVHTINQTTAAFRLSIKREERPQGDLFEPATGPYAYHVVASHWLHEEQSVHAVLVRHNQRGQAKPANRKAGIPQLLQELLKRQYPVRVLYMAGHWLDINSLDDVV